MEGGRNDAVEEFGGGENARDTRPGMGAGAAEIESFHILGDVMGTEPGTLSEDRFELKSGADVGIEPGFEIPRSKDELADKVFAEVGNNGFLQGGENLIGVSLFLLLPVDLIPRGSEMGDGRKNVKALVALGGQGWIGPGGGVEIEREILCQDSVLKNIVEETLVARAEPDGVVGEFGIGAVGAEINEEEGHAVAHGVYPSIGPFMTCGCGDFFLIEICDICIGHDHVCAKGFAGAESDAGGGTVFDEEFLDGGVESELATEVLEEFDEGLNKGAGPAHSKVHAPLAFEVVNHRVDGGGLKRIATHEEGMEGEDFTKALVFDVAGSHLPDRAVGAEADEIGGDAEHVGEGGERLVGEFDKGFLEDGVGFPDKAAVAFEVMGKMLTDLLLHFRLVAGVFEGLAVMPGDSIERFAGNDVDVVGSFFARESEQFIEEERGGEDGGAGVS